MQAHTKKGVFLVLASTLLFGSYGVWAKLIGLSFQPFYQGWTRALLICLILFPILFFTKQMVAIKREDWKWLAVFVIFTSFTSAPIFYAFTHMDIGAAYLLFFVGMLLTMYLVGFLFFREQVTLVKVVACTTACIGLYTVFSFSLERFTLLAAFMALLNGIMSGGEIAFSKKLSGSYSSLYLVWISWFAIFVTNGLLSVILREVQYVPAFSMVWLWQAINAIAGIIGFWLVIKGISYLESSVGSLLTPFEAIFGILFGIVIFHEVATTRMFVGGTLIIAAAILPHLYQLIHKQTYSPEVIRDHA